MINGIQISDISIDCANPERTWNFYIKKKSAHMVGFGDAMASLNANIQEAFVKLIYFRMTFYLSMLRIRITRNCSLT